MSDGCGCRSKALGCGTILIILGVMGLMSTCGKEDFKPVSWAQAQGSIIESRVFEYQVFKNNKLQRTTYPVYASFRYNVGGKEYVQTNWPTTGKGESPPRLNLFLVANTSADALKAMATNLRAGAPVQVYYQTENPSAYSFNKPLSPEEQARAAESSHATAVWALVIGVLLVAAPFAFSKMREIFAR